MAPFLIPQLEGAVRQGVGDPEHGQRRPDRAHDDIERAILNNEARDQNIIACSNGESRRDVHGHRRPSDQTNQ
jgi:hypothetical protein